MPVCPPPPRVAKIDTKCSTTASCFSLKKIFSAKDQSETETQPEGVNQLFSGQCPENLEPRSNVAPQSNIRVFHKVDEIDNILASEASLRENKKFQQQNVTLSGD